MGICLDSGRLDIDHHVLLCTKILNKYQNDPSKVVVIGDQILTDILGGNRMKFYTILTDPLYQKDITWTKVNRIFEKIVYKKLADSKSLIKGEYYGV